jgi:hypothetical protein
MKIVIAAAALALAAGSSAAMAQTTTSGPEVKAGATVHGTATSHPRRHRYTTGIGAENNASARGSQLPGKDKLNSKAYIQDH